MGKNYNGTLINQSATIVEKAGAAITDCRNRILKYDSNGDVVLATAGTDIPLGIAIIEAGANDVTGDTSGAVAVGDDVDIQVKGIGYVLAGGTIAKGAEVAAGSDGKAAAAAAGNYVLGIALSAATSGDYLRIQLNRYQKNPASE